MNDVVLPVADQMPETAVGLVSLPAYWEKGHGRVLAPKPNYPELGDRRPHTWKTRLSFILHEHGKAKVKGQACASNRTFEMRQQCLYQMFEALREVGFKLEDPANIDARHVAYLHREWKRRRKLCDGGESGGLAASSVANLVSVLRTFCTWIGQSQLMDYARFSDSDLIGRARAATRDLSWEGAGIDTLEIVRRAWADEPWVSVALLLQFTFGLREREAVMFRPDVASLPGEAAVRINMRRPGAGTRRMANNISGGSKGGRPRMVMIHAQWERDVLEFARRFVRRESGAGGYVGSGTQSLAFNLSAYHRVLARLGITKADAGVTGHGLRAAFAIRGLHRYGLEAPVRGGDLTTLDKKKRDLILRSVAEDLGHSRPMISTAYYGPVKTAGSVKSVDQDPDTVLTPRIAALLTDLAKEMTRRAEGKRILRTYKKQVVGR